MAQEATSAGLGALKTLLARNLDDIPDLPSYKTPPPGVYKWLIESCKQKEINQKTAVVVENVIIDTVELNDPEGTNAEHMVEPGDKFSEAFWFDDPERIDTTISVLKGKFGGLAEACGTTDLSEIMEKMVGMSVQGVIQNRVDSKDKSKVYPQTRDIVPTV
jgi:hypothetical protein